MDRNGAFTSRRGPGEGSLPQDDSKFRGTVRLLHTSPSFPSAFELNCQTSDPAAQTFSKNRLRAGEGMNVVAEENTATVSANPGSRVALTFGPAAPPLSKLRSIW